MEKDSGGSKGSISMNAIKIGKNAEAELSPKLVILNSNVQAEHKSSTQGIPKDVISYLMARGIDKKSSERLFCSCFLNQ
jgi:Fe-S cluster assembly scaffold protein SufB